MLATPIPDHPGYKIRPNGEVLNMFDRVLTPMVNVSGVMFVGLYYHGVKTNKSVARMVAHAFLPPHDNPTFDTHVHLDGDKTNCDVSNLMWRPRWFAVLWHKQFENEVLHPWGLRDQHDNIYDNSRHASIECGVLEQEILNSMRLNTWAWPTYQMFSDA